MMRIINIIHSQKVHPDRLEFYRLYLLMVHLLKFGEMYRDSVAHSDGIRFYKIQQISYYVRLNR